MNVFLDDINFSSFPSSLFFLALNESLHPCKEVQLLEVKFKIKEYVINF